MSEDHMSKEKYLKIRRDHGKMVNSGTSNGEASKRLAKLKSTESSRKNGAGKGDMAGTNPHGGSYRNAVAINEAYESGEITLDEWRLLIKENKS